MSVRMETRLEKLKEVLLQWQCEDITLEKERSDSSLELLNIARDILQTNYGDDFGDGTKCNECRMTKTYPTQTQCDRPGCYYVRVRAAIAHAEAIAMTAAAHDAKAFAGDEAGIADKERAIRSGVGYEAFKTLQEIQKYLNNCNVWAGPAIVGILRSMVSKAIAAIQVDIDGFKNLCNVYEDAGNQLVELCKLLQVRVLILDGIDEECALTTEAIHIASRIFQATADAKAAANVQE